VEEPWTILELTELAADALADAQSAGGSAVAIAASGAAAPDAAAPGGAGSDGAGSGDGASGATGSRGVALRTGRTNGRVRDVPNERLVRWYVTVGLVDPPLSRRGRVARYGRRHLLQLVAVKRRQAEGRSLAEIQAELAGATDEALAAVARVPDARLAPKAAEQGAPAPAAPARFWARGSAQDRDPVRAERDGGRDAGDAGQARLADDVGQAELADDVGQTGLSGDLGRTGLARGGGGHGGWGDGGRGGIVHGVRLAPGVMLLLEGAGREPGPQDVSEIVNAAQPLLEVLGSRRLCAFDPGHLVDGPGVPPDVGQLAEEGRT
jgi:DNA-binding transcriptional MerR regulator